VINVLIELTVLGLLNDAPQHGYVLRQQASLLLERPLSDGALYPAIKRLLDAGAIDTQPDKSLAITATLVRKRDGAGTNNDGAPVAASATPSLAGELHALRLRRQARDAAAAESATTLRGRARGRKTYAITPAGVQLLQELLDTQSANGDDDVFALKMQFARYLTPESRIALFESRRLRLQQRLADMRQRLRVGANNLDRYVRAQIEHSINRTQLEIAWLDRLLADEPKPTSPDSSLPQQLTER